MICRLSQSIQMIANASNIIQNNRTLKQETFSNILKQTVQSKQQGYLGTVSINQSIMPGKHNSTRPIITRHQSSKSPDPTQTPRKPPKKPDLPQPRPKPHPTPKPRPGPKNPPSAPRIGPAGKHGDDDFDDRHDALDDPHQEGADGVDDGEEEDADGLEYVCDLGVSLVSVFVVVFVLVLVASG